jgi:uncharacterized protein YecT (DUF1311 family)
MKQSVAILTLLLSTILFANNIQCKEDGNQMEMNQCAYEDFQKADKELNKVYQEVRKKNTNDKLFLKNLKTSQRLWLKFLDAELNAIYSCPEGNQRICFGSMFPLLYNGSKTELTKDRTKQLKRYLEDSMR